MNAELPGMPGQFGEEPGLGGKHGLELGRFHHACAISSIKMDA